jgi:RNA ligase (TIGR02306 family)
MANKLVYVGRIVQLDTIPNAERIVLATAVCGAGGKWLGVVGKDQFAIGDMCRVYLQDSILPQDAEFAFMAKQDYRIRMQRFRGVPSECLIMPSVTSAGFDTGKLLIGTDITDLMAVEKYEKPLPISISGEQLSNFPSFIPKTDEPHFQRVPLMLEKLAGQSWEATVKCDGTSTTAYYYDGHFGVCSRNYELRETASDAHWQVARRYNMEKFLTTLDSGERLLALQWETIGPGIQGNPMGVKQVDGRLFNVYDIGERAYLNNAAVRMIGDAIAMPVVECIAHNDYFDRTDDELRTLAEGVYPNGAQREGIVIRPRNEQLVNGERLSFKVLNLRYKG